METFFSYDHEYGSVVSSFCSGQTLSFYNKQELGTCVAMRQPRKAGRCQARQSGVGDTERKGIYTPSVNILQVL